MDREQALRILDPAAMDTGELLHLAYVVRRKFFGRKVMIHILNNVQNGLCPEDCRYCVQSTSSTAPIEEYPMKSDDEILAEAAAAHQHGAGRYCMVFSGTGPTDGRIEHLCRIVRGIKSRYPIEVCVSPGVINEAQARQLKSAGLDRLNHNLNTSSEHYRNICTTHGYESRIKTLEAAHAAGLAICSGVIIGMGESREDVYEMALRFRKLEVASIPVNFFMPLEGAAIKEASGLTPEYCLRVLCLFRFLNPSTDIRMAAGREMHLRGLQPLGLYAASSLFLRGYLNAQGGEDITTLQMIKDMGFTIESDIPIDGLLAHSGQSHCRKEFKGQKELRPFKPE